MKKYIYMAVAAIAVLSSCNNEDIITETTEAPSVNAKYPTFTASIEGTATRTTLATGNKVNWVDGDEVLMLFSGSNDEEVAAMYIYKAIPGAEASAATLEHKTDIYANHEADELNYAIYPASMFSPSDFGLIFPATQTYNGDDISFAPMFWTKEYVEEGSSDLTFKNAAALLKITVPSTQMTNVTSITVSSDRLMNGEISFDEDGYFYICGEKVGVFPAVTPENSKITLNIPSGITIPDGESKTFYISILPLDDDTNVAQDDHYDYLQIDVTDGTTTKSMRTNKADGIQIERNKIYPITFAENYVAPAVWENPLTLGRYSGAESAANSIVIETGIVLNSYIVDDTHKKLNAAGTLWEVYDTESKTLKIQTSADKILGHDSFDDAGLFYYYENVESITGLSNLDMSQVTNMTGMFYNCQALTTLDVSSFDTHKVTDMSYMFKSCTNLTSINLGTNFTTQSVTTMRGMFSDCLVLPTLDVSNFDTSNVTDMGYMFWDCLVLPTLDVSNFDTSSVTDMEGMFGCCFKIASLTLSSDFKLASSNSDMFVQMGYELDQGATCVIYNAPDDIQTLINTNASRWYISGKINFETK